MKYLTPFALPALLALLVCAALPTQAHDGHDHGEAPARTAGPALPRFAASSDLFELVGVVDGRRLTLYLDRFVDNAPVPGAAIELELGGAKVALTEKAPGEFEATLAQALPPGTTAVTATVIAGSDTDLLAGDLVAPEATHAHEAAGPGRSRRLAWGLAGTGALAAVLVAGWFIARRRTAHRSARIGGVA